MSVFRYVWGSLPSYLLCALILGTFGPPLVGHAQSEQLSPGSKLPSIDAPLQRLNGSSVSVSSLLGTNGTVFLFWSNQCPWIDRCEDRVERLAQTFEPEGIQFVLVNANDASQAPQESLQASRTRAEQHGYQIPYVHDPNAALARALGATRTPHAFLFDAQRTLVYAGALDDSPSDPDRVQQPYLRNAISALLDGETPEVRSTKAFGCTLKYPG